LHFLPGINMFNYGSLVSETRKNGSPCLDEVSVRQMFLQIIRVGT
jgi:hypothetical protein